MELLGTPRRFHLSRHPLRTVSVASIVYMVILLLASECRSYPISNHSIGIEPPQSVDRVREMAVSVDDQHMMLGVKYREAAGGGKAYLYRRVHEQEWELELTLDPPESWSEVGEAVHVDFEKRWLFASISETAEENADDEECADPPVIPGQHVIRNYHCGQVYWWQFDIGADGTYSVVKTQVISAPPSTPNFGIHLDHWDRTLVATTRYGMELIDLAGDQPRVYRTYLFNDLVKDFFDYDLAEFVVNKCEISSKYIVCSIGTHVHSYLDPYPPVDAVSDPFVLLFAWDGNDYEFERIFHYKELLPEGDHFFELRRVQVGLDKVFDQFAVGFASRGTGAREVIDANGNVVLERVRFDPGQVVVIEKIDDEWKHQRIELDLNSQNFNVSFFGHAVSCDSGSCLACMFAFGDSGSNGCFLIVKDEAQGKWLIDKQLNGDNGGVYTGGFGHEAILRKGTGIITATDRVSIFDNVAIINTKKAVTVEDVWCYGAESLVSVQKPRALEPRTMALEDVEVGDRVLSVNSAGETVYSEVFLHQHIADDTLHPVLEVSYEGTEGGEGAREGVLTVTKGHLLVTGWTRRGGLEYTAADELRVGSTLLLLDEADREPIRGVVASIRETTSRLRNVHTMDDRIVVSGVVGSCVARVQAFSKVPYWHTVVAYLTLPLKAMHAVGLRAPIPILDSVAHSAAVLLNSLSR